MIHFHEVEKSDGTRQVFRNLTLFLPKASYTLLCGGQQSGKTMLVRMLMAYERPDRGTLRVDGIDIGTIPADRIPFLRRQIGLIADTPAFLEDRTVAENLSVPLQLAGFEQELIQTRLHAMLDHTGLQELQNQKLHKLSRPTRHLISVARATIHKPTIVVADEPLSDSDADTSDLIIRLLNDANTYGATVLITCQSDAAQLLQASSTVKTLTLADGSILEDEFDQNKSPDNNTRGYQR